MNVELNPENRNNQVILPQRGRCSFCRNPHHNISRCNDRRLLEFQQLCITREAQNVDGFKNWLINYSINNSYIMKAYAVRYCGCYTRYHMGLCIHYIIIKIRELNINSGLREMGREYIVSNLLNESQNDEFIEVYGVGISMVVCRYTINTKFNIKTTIAECSQGVSCECSICYDDKEKHRFVKLNCGHEFCKDCIKQTLENDTSRNPCCALCRSEITNIECTSKEMSDEFNNFIIV